MRGRAAVKGFAATVWAAVLFFVLAGSAFAAFPGANGKIAFERQLDARGGADVWAMNPDGTDQSNLTNTRGQGAPDWSSDGSRIVLGYGQIFTMNADGTNLVQPTNDDLLKWNPVWSPDGSRIAFEGGFLQSQIYVMNADGTNQTRLTERGFHDDRPSWSPDGTRIAFQRSELIFCSDPECEDVQERPPDIFTMNADGTGKVNLTSTPGVREESPDWSPDGTKIAFDAPYDGNYEIYTMNADGSGVVRVTSSTPRGDHAPAWSPDGSKIAFYRFVGPFYWDSEIFTINVDGTGETRLTSNTAADVDPDWQPIPGPDRGDFKNAAQFCKAKREFMGRAAFEQAYGSNGLGRCVTADTG